MSTYQVKYLQYHIYFDFTKAVKVTEIDDTYYPIKYNLTQPNYGLFDNYYIEKEGIKYHIICKSKIHGKQIILNGKIVEYQVANQNMYY